MKKVRLKKRFYIIIICLVLLVVACGIFLISLIGDSKIPIAQVKSDPIKITITCAGDIVLHDPNIASAYDKKTDTYNFDSNFTYINPYIKKADLAMCTIETTFPGKPYTGYPAFRGPDALATSLKTAGFDMVMTSSNHAYDSGIKGIKKTVEVLRSNDLIAAGTRLTSEEPRYAMAKVKGVKIAMIAYTYETGPADDTTTYLNANPLTAEAASLVNSFNYGRLDQDVAEMKQIADEARAAGAEIILVYFHWGEEYHLTPNEYQQALAQKVADAVGADIIFASHPHVPQPPAVITVMKKQEDGTTTEKKVPVFYALGNFLSNQRRELIPSGGRYVEEGYLAQTTVTFDPNKKQVKFVKWTAMPYWVDKYSASGKFNYAIVPLDKNYKTNEALIKSGHLSKAEQASKDLNEILGTQ